MIDYSNRWIEPCPTMFHRWWDNDPKEGVYMLIKDDECIYVGMSCNIRRRLNQHRYRINFDYAMCYEIENKSYSYVSNIESLLIKRIQPKLNKVVK